MRSNMSGRVAIVGAGPAGLMAAEVAADAGAAVTLYERMPSPGRKLLLAGRGGLNLTHGEPADAFAARYGLAAAALRPALAGFGPDALRAWCAALGVDTFVGTSGRVFPETMKTSPLLRAWLRRLDAGGVAIRPRHHWRGWDAAGRLAFDAPEGPITVEAEASVLALGGASWPRLGSDGDWTTPLAAAGVPVSPLRPANCGFAVGWSAPFRERFAGAPLHNVALDFDGSRARGEAMVTAAGLEGGAVYALAAPLRDAIEADGAATLRVALRPDLAHDTLVAKLGRRRPKESLTNGLRKALSLDPVAIGLLREATIAGPPLAALDDGALATLLNAVPVRLTAPMPIAEAISSAGGVSLTALDDALMLRERPGVFVAGEMLDWEAPTGGYLLQACFATGAMAGRGVVEWLGGANRPSEWVDAEETKT